MRSPTQNSLKRLRDDGWEPWIVEFFNTFVKRRYDLWNFGDIIAEKQGEPHLIVQTTSYSGVSARVKKILAEPRAKLWLETGGIIEVHGWHKKPKVKGGKQLVWTCRNVPITLEMYDGDH